MLTEDPFNAFWSVFVQEHWELRPAVFHQLFAQPLISSARAFENVIAAGARWSEGQPARLRFFIENALLQSRMDKYLPVPGDGSFHAYARRLSPMLQGQGFGLVVNGFAHYDFPLFTSVRNFLRGLYERVGMPCDTTDLDAFIGNYRRTPFGIHTDTASNFSIVFEGRKRFLLWPEPALRGRPDLAHSPDIDDVRESAIVLEAAVGDVVYWPASYWHIAESDGSLSGVLNIALYLGDTSQRFVTSALAPSSRVGGSSERTFSWDPQLSRKPLIPELIQRGIQAHCAPRPSEQDVGRAVRRAWLQRVTAYNFSHSFPPLATPQALAATDSVQIENNFPIATLEEDERLLCAAHGHVIEVPALASVRDLVSRLNSGRPASVSELVTQAARPGVLGSRSVDVRPEDVELLLDNLLAMRAIHRASE